MTYNMILTPEQEQRRKDSKQALESLKYNPMCYGCKSCVQDVTEPPKSCGTAASGTRKPIFRVFTHWQHMPQN